MQICLLSGVRPSGALATGDGLLSDYSEEESQESEDFESEEEEDKVAEAAGPKRGRSELVLKAPTQSETTQTFEAQFPKRARGSLYDD